MADVTLSAAVRSSLLSLQGTSDLIKQTQGRLSTGLKVASAIDDPVAYFQAKSLSDRASDLTQKKDGINQGVSSVSAALDAVTAVENVVQQLKGLAQSLKSATGTQFTDLITQFNSLRTQIGTLVTDATYQGTNLVNNTSQTLTVTFSEKTASLLTVNAAKLDQQGLLVGSLATYVSNSSTFQINYSAAVSATLTAGGSVVITYKGADVTFASGAYAHLSYGTGTDAQLYVGTGNTLVLTQGAVYTASIKTISAVAVSGVSFLIGAINTASLEVNYAASTGTMSGGVSITYKGPDQVFATGNTDFKVSVGTTILTFSTTSVTGSYTLTQGTVITSVAGITAGGTTAALASAGFTGFSTKAALANALDVSYSKASAVTVDGVYTTYVSVGDSTQISAAIAQLDASLSTLRSQASSLGSNVALLQTRLNFTDSYTNTLTTGASKLTLADINTEGANLLALQTRQQLGITSLSFAGKAEQNILRLFR